MDQIILAANLVLKTVIPTFIFPNLTSLLDDSVIFSTPINSYKTLKEGWFLLTNLHVNPYDSMINHPPVLLQITSLFDMENDLLMNFIYAMVDTMTLYTVMQLNNKLIKSNQSARWFYVLNPLILLGCWSKNTVNFSNLFILMSLNSLLNQEFSKSMINLSFASYLSINPIFLLIPLLNYINFYKKNWKLHLVIFITSLSLLFLNSINFDLSKVWYNCYVSIIKFEKIQPNLGLWWYFFMEIFEFFHDFYIALFNMYSFLFIVPFNYRFSKNPLFNILVSALWINFTKSYSTINDLNLSTILIMTIGYQYLNRLRIPIVLSAIVMSVVLTLLTLFYYLWVDLSSGNSNFFYGVGLVYNMLIAWTICDLIWVQLQQNWFKENKLSEDSNVRLTQF